MNARALGIGVAAAAVPIASAGMSRGCGGACGGCFACAVPVAIVAAGVAAVVAAPLIGRLRGGDGASGSPGEEGTGTPPPVSR